MGIFCVTALLSFSYSQQVVFLWIWKLKLGRAVLHTCCNGVNVRSGNASNSEILYQCLKD